MTRVTARKCPSSKILLVLIPEGTGSYTRVELVVMSVGMMRCTGGSGSTCTGKAGITAIVVLLLMRLVLKLRSMLACSRNLRLLRERLLSIATMMATMMITVMFGRLVGAYTSSSGTCSDTCIPAVMVLSTLTGGSLLRNRTSRGHHIILSRSTVG